MRVASGTGKTGKTGISRETADRLGLELVSRCQRSATASLRRIGGPVHAPRARRRSLRQYLDAVVAS